MQEKDIVVGLDIGTTKIDVIVAKVNEEGEVEIVGVGTSPSEGLRRGVVINLEKTVQSITRAVEGAELMSGVEIRSVYAGIAGDHIRSLNSRGVIAVSRPDKEITEEDIVRVIEAAKALSIPQDREVIHVLPQEYIVDDQKGIRYPVGMSGVRLEVNVHVITAATTSAQNVYKSIRKAGIEVADLVLQPLASSYAVLSEDERELGVALLDVGGGTTDIALFFEGSIKHTAVIGLGGQNVTNDIAIGLRTPLKQAERIKIEYGCALESIVEEREMINVPGVGGRPDREVSRKTLASVIEPRMEEIFSLALWEIQKSDYVDLLTTGVVITGGASLMPGTVELASRVFDMPVRLGIPWGFGGLTDPAQSPLHATGIGLILYALDHRAKHNGMMRIASENLFFHRILEKMRNWFGEFI